MCSENELGAILTVCDGYVKPQVIWPSQKQNNKALTLAHAQTIHYTSNQATP